MSESTNKPRLHEKKAFGSISSHFISLPATLASCILLPSVLRCTPYETWENLGCLTRLRHLTALFHQCRYNGPPF
jgi:hypothetical protein